MGFRYKLDKSSESVVGDLIGIGICFVIICILGWWTKRDEENRKNGTSESSTFASLGSHVKRDHIAKLFNEIARMPDDKISDILDHVNIAATPKMLEANIKLQQQLLAEYKKFNQSRFSLLHASIDDILEYKGSVRSTCEKLNTRYYDNALDDEFGWNCIPSDYKGLFSEVKAPCETKSLRENGWTKSNLRILGQHILHFGYAALPFENTAKKDAEKFEDECMVILKKNIKKLDWVDDPDDPDGMEQHVNDDEGPVSYLFGQQEEWLGWAFLDHTHFNKSAMGPDLGLTTSIAATLGICKVLKREFGIEK